MDDSKSVKRIPFQIASVLLAGLFLWASTAKGDEVPPLSDESQGCVDCHVYATPGIVSGWKQGRMAQMTPEWP
jgi:hydroxylamine dehydrogenase